ncbi:MAG: MgtC/SapB family protein [Verrucomicrobiota bacterium]
MDQWDIFFRLGSALIAGTVLGIERESHGRAAGLRTTLLVCLAATIAMILSQGFYYETVHPGVDNGWHPDPARLAAGILTGIGFLGGGAIIRQGNMVHGVTTAAVLWFVTVLGLCFGSGHYGLGWAGFGCAIFALFGLPKIEKMVRNDTYAELYVTLQDETSTNDQIRKAILQEGLRVKAMEIEYRVVDRIRVLHFGLKFKRRDTVELSQRMIQKISQFPGVMQIKWE